MQGVCGWGCGAQVVAVVRCLVREGKAVGGGQAELQLNSQQPHSSQPSERFAASRSLEPF